MSKKAPEKKHAVIILADGFEEIEAITPIDLLRRAGIDVCIAGISPNHHCVSGSHGIRIPVDMDADDITDHFDACIFPGGMPGAENLAASQRILLLIKEMHAQKKLIAAICAAPAILLAPLGILDGRHATCFPGMEHAFSKNTIFRAEPVVCDGHIITSRGPGTAIEFSLKIIASLINPDTAVTLRSKILAD